MKPVYTSLLSGAVILVLVFFLYFSQYGFFKKIELGIADTLIAQLEQSEPTGFVTIVDIDEKSLSQFGQWPWSRNNVAKLLDELQKMQPLAIGLDFLFAEPDRTSLKQMQSDLQSNYQLPLNLAHIPAELLDNDQQMAEVLKQGPFILGYAFNFAEHQQPVVEDKTNNLHSIPLLILYQGDAVEDNTLLWYQPSSVTQNIPVFSNAVKYSGFLNSSPGLDGVLRKTPLLMQYQNKYYPSLSLAMLMRVLQPQQVMLTVSVNGIESLVIDDQQIPLDKRGNFFIHFRDAKKSAFQTISAADILTGNVSKQQLANKIILLGSSAKGLHDLKSTPYNAIFAGVGVHATTIDNILRGDFISRPDMARIIELLLILAAGLLSLVLVIYTKVLMSFIAHIALLIFLSYTSWWYLQQGEYLSTFYPILMVLLNFTLLSVWQYWNKEKKLLQQTIALNSIQENALALLKQKNFKLEKTTLNQEKNSLKLEQNSLDLTQQIDKNTQQLSHVFAALDSANQEIIDSLLYGARIQRSILPKAKNFSQSFKDSFIIWESKNKVGGDIYFSSQTAVGHIIAVIDCTGHGIPGALLSMIAVPALQKITQNPDCYENPAEILKQLNYSVKTTLGQEQDNAVADDGLEISICCINSNKKILRYAGAGLPFLYIKDEQLINVRADKQKIGYRQSKQSDINFQFTQHDISLDAPMWCYLYTDGFVDQVGGKKKFPLGNKRFKAFLLEHYRLDFKHQRQQLLDFFMDYQGEETRRDDITVIGFYL